MFAFEGDRSVQQRGDGGATAELQIDTEKDKDGRAMREKVLATAAHARRVSRTTKYTREQQLRGLPSGFRKEHSIASEKGGGAHGPMRASANVRMTFIMDYKPDICKDYKETGYCGYGDSANLCTTEGITSTGWQLDREWEEKEKARKEALAKLEQMERGLGGGRRGPGRGGR